MLTSMSVTVREFKHLKLQLLHDIKFRQIEIQTSSILHDGLSIISFKISDSKYLFQQFMGISFFKSGWLFRQQKIFH